MATPENSNGITITLFGQEFIAASNFAEIKGIEEDKIIYMIRDGFYDGRLYEGQWYVSKAELPSNADQLIQSTLDANPSINASTSTSANGSIIGSTNASINKSNSHIFTFENFMAGETDFFSSFMYFFFINMSFVALQLKFSDSGIGSLLILGHIAYGIAVSIGAFRSAHKQIKDSFWANAMKGLIIILVCGALFSDYWLLMSG